MAAGTISDHISTGKQREQIGSEYGEFYKLSKPVLVKYFIQGVP